MADTPDPGTQAVVDSLNPAPDTSSLPASTNAPVPDPSVAAPPPDTSSLPVSTNTPVNAPTPAGTPAAQKPSLWRGVLAGALQGLAAGSAVNTRGMGSGSAIAAGIGAGVNQTLNVKPREQAELQMQQQQAAATTALHYVNLQRAQRELNLMPDDKREQYLNQAADESDAMLKNGAITPMSQPGDIASAQQTLQQLHAKNPWAVYSVMPVRGTDGTMQYSAVQFGKAPLQEDLVLKGIGENGSDITIPAGTPGEQVGKIYTQAFTKRLDNETKKTVATGNQKNRLAVQGLKNEGAVDVANIKAASAAAAKNEKAPDMAFGTIVDNGTPRQIAGSPAELAQAGATGVTKLSGTEGQKVVVARQLIGPRKGLFDMVNNDINQLSKEGKIGTVASRWGDFMAGKVGDEPDFQPLRTHMGLLSTALMQAHVGARGSKDMLEHFKELANYSISNESTLRKAIQSEWDYVNEKAMLPPNNPMAGRTGPGQTGPAAAPQSFAAWKSSQGAQ